MFSGSQALRVVPKYACNGIDASSAKVTNDSLERSREITSTSLARRRLWRKLNSCSPRRALADAPPFGGNRGWSVQSRMVSAMTQ